MSVRQEIAQRIANFINRNGMTTPFGGEIIKAGNHYTIHFSKAPVLYGSIDIYGSKFIRIIYVTQHSALPYRASPVFESELAAIDFLNKAFVLQDFDGAKAIPLKAK